MSGKKKSKIDALLDEAKDGSLRIAEVSSNLKDKILSRMASDLMVNKNYILRENRKDVQKAKMNKQPGSFIDRLSLNDKRIKAMAKSLKEISVLKDPVGSVILRRRMPNGLDIRKVRTPIGVIFIIYEARPNVTSDCVGLCLKSSNVSILRGGSLSLGTNKSIFKVLSSSAEVEGLKGFFFFVDTPEHSTVDYILKKGAGKIDLVIPRGGESLIRKVAAVSKIPVLKHYKGVCHIYIDSQADIKKAVDICVNAKAQRPAVCNAVETLLVHSGVSAKFLPLLKQAMDKHSVELRGCDKTRRILKGIKKAVERDWYTEYLDLILSVKVVESLEEAIAHINNYGSAHTDSILSKNSYNIKKFNEQVQSACVFNNISTRFSDGGELGLGAEMGISTDKLHARGPVGVEELTTYKWVVSGTGQVRE